MPRQGWRRSNRHRPESLSQGPGSGAARNSKSQRRRNSLHYSEWRAADGNAGAWKSARRTGRYDGVEAGDFRSLHRPGHSFGKYAAECQQPLRRITSARPRAKNATARFTSAGRRRRWPTWCAIRANIPTRSFRTSLPIMSVRNSRRTRWRSSTAASGSSVTSPKSATTIFRSPRNGT